MEEPLKARLIGASILVVLAVALVPELLSGPKHSAPGDAMPGSAKGTRTVTIDLGGAVAAGAKLEPRPDTVPASAPPQALPTVETPTPEPTPAAKTATTADESVPTEETPPSEAVTVAAPKPAPALAPAPKQVQAQTTPAKPEVKPSVAAPAVPAAASAQGGYSVQVGAFGSDATARKLVNDLKAEGLPAYIAPLSKSGKTLHRVRVGPTADRAAADKLAVKLKARGLPVSVVTGG
jgi:DedD protein